MKFYTLLLNLLLLLTFPISAQTNVLIAYHSESGNTERMAEAVAEGARSIEGVNVMLLPVNQTQESDLLQADAIIVGSPVHNANVSTEIQQFFTSWPFENEPLKNKIGAVFVTGGGISAGEEIVQMNMIQSMLVFGMIIVGGPDWTQPFGASAITGEDPFQVNSSNELSEQFLEKGNLLGHRVAQIASAIKWTEKN
ncbi:MAG: flavodoxin family protein [Balneolaceae bacterium]|nr:flavodoxin family protein [Balneolaceae bacterium]